MKVIKVITSVLILLVVLAIGFYGYMGGLRPVQLKPVTFQATEIIYSTYKGPYQNLAEPWAKFSDKVISLGLKDCDNYGVYLDSPDTPPENLRTILACGINGVEEPLKEKLRAEFKTFVLPEAQSYVAEFPYRNELSFMMGAAKVYTAFQGMIGSGDITPSVAIEAYGPDEGRSKILYYMPSSKSQEDYRALFESF